MVMARKDLSTVTMREVLNSMFASSTSICSDKVKRPMDKTGERREHVWERVGHCDLTLTLPNVASTPRVHELIVTNAETLHWSALDAAWLNLIVGHAKLNRYCKRRRPIPMPVYCKTRSGCAPQAIIAA